jgi:hypothetical protein
MTPYLITVAVHICAVYGYHVPRSKVGGQRQGVGAVAEKGPTTCASTGHFCWRTCRRCTLAHSRQLQAVCVEACRHRLHLRSHRKPWRVHWCNDAYGGDLEGGGRCAACGTGSTTRRTPQESARRGTVTNLDHEWAGCYQGAELHRHEQLRGIRQAAQKST